jgi:phage shock protein PspC (stress-responsive transcriptional regulator)
MRVLYVLVSVFSVAFPGIIAYIVLMFLMPPPEEVTA